MDDLDPRGTQCRGALHDLADIARHEDWAYGDAQNSRTPFPILRNYLINTFYKQYRDGRVAEVTHGGKSWAAFNTGLVDDRYDPIFALYEQNDRPPRPWKFYSFCRPNIGRDGQILARNFNPLPAAPKYFAKAEDVIFDPDTPIQPRYDHIVYDSIEKDRYPIEFLKEHVPNGVKWKDLEELESTDRKAFLRGFREALESDPRTDRDVRNRINDAIDLAVKRARWNFKTAIPLYYPKANAISLLLPIALVDDDKVDLALVVTRTAAGAYSGETVYKLKWAYDHARLVCRPDSDWLTPSAGDGIEDDEEPAQEVDAQSHVAHEAMASSEADATLPFGEQPSGKSSSAQQQSAQKDSWTTTAFVKIYRDSENQAWVKHQLVHFESSRGQGNFEKVDSRLAEVVFSYQNEDERCVAFSLQITSPSPVLTKKDGITKNLGIKPDKIEIGPGDQIFTDDWIFEFQDASMGIRW